MWLNDDYGIGDGDANGGGDGDGGGGGGGSDNCGDVSDKDKDDGVDYGGGNKYSRYTSDYEVIFFVNLYCYDECHDFNDGDNGGDHFSGGYGNIQLLACYLRDSSALSYCHLLPTF